MEIGIEVAHEVDFGRYTLSLDGASSPMVLSSLEQPGRDPCRPSWHVCATQHPMRSGDPEWIHRAQGAGVCARLMQGERVDAVEAQDRIGRWEATDEQTQPFGESIPCLGFGRGGRI